MRRAKIVMAFVAEMAGIALLAAAIAIPPAGEISASVLTAAGEVLTFAGSIIGVDYFFKSRSNQ